MTSQHGKSVLVFLFDFDGNPGDFISVVIIDWGLRIANPQFGFAFGFLLFIVFQTVFKEVKYKT